jgi:hypothetical protein
MRWETFWREVRGDDNVHTSMFEFMQQEWEPTSRPAAACWILMYCLFMVYAALNESGFLFIDNVNLIVHEAGHLLFGWLGETPGLWGGTIFQWLVPALLAAYFFTERKLYGFIFCAFVFFENFLYTATYMADARAQVLPLVSVGGGDEAGHDWFNIFSSLGVLQHDTRIAGVVRLLGWCGMIATVGWFGIRSLRGSEEGQ